MLKPASISTSKMAGAAVAASALMKALSNEHRLLILCHLISEDELTVGELVSRIGLSQSALSQHLAKLREERLVAFRRDAQTLFYRVCDDRAGRVLSLLYEMFCPDNDNGVSWNSPMASAAANKEKSGEGG